MSGGAGAGSRDCVAEVAFVVSCVCLRRFAGRSSPSKDVVNTTASI